MPSKPDSSPKSAVDLRMVVVWVEGFLGWGLFGGRIFGMGFVWGKDFWDGVCLGEGFLGWGLFGGRGDL